MLPSDLESVVGVGQPAVSPDGRTVAFVVVRAHAEGNDYRSQVWLAATDGSAPPRPFSSGEQQDGTPAWSPDGSRLAFTSARTRGHTEGHGDSTAGRAHVRIRVAPVHGGGEVVTVAEQPDEVGNLRWSPDGRLIAFNARTPDPAYSESDQRRRPPRRITRLFSRLDNTGFVADRPMHVYVVPADGSAPARNLTPGPYALTQPSWTPDSAALVVAGATHDGWDLDLRTDLHLVDVTGSEVRRLTATTGVYGSPSVSPDGSRVAFLGTDDATTSPRNSHVAVMPLAGGEHHWVSRHLDRTFEPYPDRRPPHWLDEDTLLAGAEDRGGVHLYRLDADGTRPPQPLWRGEGVVTGFDEAAGAVAFTISTPTRPGEVHVLDVGDEGGRERRLTDITAAFAERARLRPYERFTVPSADGTVDLDAWVLTPPDLDPDGSYPTLVNVHGGPFTQYAERFFDEVQVQARAGYVAVWCNPRGSSGREEAFGRAIVGPALGGTGWGSVDFDDVMAVVDHVVRTRPYVDRERLGILGGSYGGYMTSWAVGHTDRFRAACSERAANNLLSLEWASDAAGAFRTIMGASHLDDPDLYLRMSPVSYVKDIDTPLLILHSENDLRCPVEQADQLFVALRLLERDVELVRFPAESHELSRSGSPVHRRQRAEIILDFFSRTLKA